VANFAVMGEIESGAALSVRRAPTANAFEKMNDASMAIEAARLVVVKPNTFITIAPFSGVENVRRTAVHAFLIKARALIQNEYVIGFMR
jgi:hypothetical protein